MKKKEIKKENDVNERFGFLVHKSGSVEITDTPTNVDDEDVARLAADFAARTGIVDNNAIQILVPDNLFRKISTQMMLSEIASSYIGYMANIDIVVIDGKDSESDWIHESNSYNKSTLRVIRSGKPIAKYVYLTDKLNRVAKKKSCDAYIEYGVIFEDQAFANKYVDRLEHLLKIKANVNDDEKFIRYMAEVDIRILESFTSAMYTMVDDFSSNRNDEIYRMAEKTVRFISNLYNNYTIEPGDITYEDFLTLSQYSGNKIKIDDILKRYSEFRGKVDAYIKYVHYGFNPKFALRNFSELDTVLSLITVYPECKEVAKLVYNNDNGREIKSFIELFETIACGFGSKEIELNASDEAKKMIEKKPVESLAFIMAIKASYPSMRGFELDQFYMDYIKNDLYNEYRGFFGNTEAKDGKTKVICPASWVLPSDRVWLMLNFMKYSMRQNLPYFRNIGRSMVAVSFDDPDTGKKIFEDLVCSSFNPSEYRISHIIDANGNLVPQNVKYTEIDNMLRGGE